MSEPSELPDLDFDEPLGAAQGVIAYSNLDDYYFSGEKNHFAGVYMGYKYQCVEYSRRHMMITQSCIFGQCGPAAEIYAMKTVENVETGETLPFIACDNMKTKVKPRVGMTIIYPICKKMPVGHVCTVSAVGDDWVGIAEQNQESKSWQGRPYGRKVPLLIDEDGNYHLKETDPALVDSCGWLYIEGGVFRELVNPNATEEELSAINEVNAQGKAYPPLKPLEKFVASAPPKSRLARFAVPAVSPGARRMKTIIEQVADRQLETGESDRIIGEYEQLVQQRFKETEEARTHHHAHPEADTAVRRAAVARSTNWHSVYAPNEPLAIGSIGATHVCFKIVEEAVKDLLNTKPAKEISGLFGIPEELAVAAAEHLANATNHSVQLSAGDFVFGTLGLAYDDSVGTFKVIHTEFDSMSNVIDIHALQDQCSADHGLARGWRMTTFGNDVNRAVRNIQRSKYASKKAELPILFVDLGSAADLESRGLKFASDVARYEYEVEHVNHRYFHQCMIAFLDGKKKDLENGDLCEEDLPLWTVTRVNLFDESVVIGDDGFVTVNGTTFRMIMKMAPWSTLFSFAQHHAKVNTFLTNVAKKHNVFQPLWTHIASSPVFLPFLSRLVEAKYANVSPSESDPRVHVIPSSCWKDSVDGSARPKCDYRVKRFQGLEDPENPAKDESQVSENDHSDEKAASFFPATHCLVGGGKRSAAMYLEGRSCEADAEGCGIYDLVHPAPMALMPFLPGWRDEQ